MSKMKLLLLAGLAAAGYVASRNRRNAALSTSAASDQPARRPRAIDRWEGEGGGVPVSDERTAAQLDVSPDPVAAEAHDTTEADR